jgi:hypothetical protein
MIKNLKNNTSGIVLPTLVFIYLAVTISALALATFTVDHFARVNRNLLATNALLTAEAGAEQTLHELNQDSSFGGFSIDQEFFNNTSQGEGIYTTVVQNGSINNEKIITSTGSVYRRSTDSQPTVVRKVRLIVVGTTTGDYAVQTGPGGLIMNNSATIANGDVYVNGYLTMNNSSRIGTNLTPAKVWIAHNNCPTGGGSTFPEQCTSGEPATITNPAAIYGEVRANNQIFGSSSSDRMYLPGLVSNSGVSPITLPGYDRAPQVAAVTTTINGANASCNGSQTRTYEANTKIIGNVDIRNRCEVEIKGDVWITGNLTLRNSSSLRVNDLITTSPNIMIDGSSGLKIQNSALILANSLSKGFNFISFHSAAACSPDCTDLTGTDLYNSRNMLTIDLDNASLAAGSNFYARWSKVALANGGTIGSVIGQTVELNNSGSIVFGTNLSSGDTLWAIKTYQQIFD